MSPEASQLLARLNAAILREAGAATFAEHQLVTAGQLDHAELLQRRLRRLEWMSILNNVIMWVPILLVVLAGAIWERPAPLATVSGALGPVLFVIYNQFNLHRTLVRLEALQLLQQVLQAETGLNVATASAA